MAQCRGYKRDGTPCTVGVSPGVDYCYNHDPARADERRRNASRAGQSRGSAELRTIKGDLRTLIKRVLDGEVGTGRAAVALQGYNALLRAAEQERRWLETESLEAEIERLKDALSA